jgi:glucokinase
VGGVTCGIDLGGTKIQAVVLDSDRVLGEARVPTPSSGPDEVIAAMVEAARAALDQAGIGPDELTSVGIGSPGEIDREAGAVSLASNVPGFSDPVPVATAVSDAMGGVPVRVDNDVRVAVLGEHERGAGRGYSDVLGVFVGTGVGGGLILEGKLRVGRGGAGEIGHTVVKDGGRRCACGRSGCLEAYAGRGSMERTARELAAKGRKTILFDVMQKRGRDRVTSGVIAKALEHGDKLTARLIEDAVWALGVALASAQNLLDLEAIIVGGGLGDRLGAPFVDRVSRAMQPHLFVPSRSPAMLTTKFGDLSGALGAAVLAAGRA